MPQPLVNRTLIAWFKGHFAARRCLHWHSQLGQKLKSLYPGREYGGAWTIRLMGELEEAGIVGLSRDLVYKTLAVANALTPAQIAEYARNGLTWSHIRVVLVVSGKAAGIETNEQSIRGGRLVKLLDMTVAKSWSVRRLQQELLTLQPTGRAVPRPKSKGWDADLSLLNRLTADWNKYSAIWDTITETARRRVRARRSAAAKAAVDSIKLMLKSAEQLRDAMADN